MTAITTQKIGPYCYINLSDSKWDKTQKYTTNKKIPIGTIDRKTGVPIFKYDFLASLDHDSDLAMRLKERFPTANFEVPMRNIPDLPLGIGQYPGETVRYGLTYFLYGIAKRIGLIGPLQTAFGAIWKELFTIVSYLISDHGALMYCDDFLEEHLTFDVGSMSSQNTSYILSQITNKDIDIFTELWSKVIAEEELIVLDGSSHSTYSEKIEEAEWGKNKDGDELKQVNTMVFCGLKSKRPIRQYVYNGSLTDVAVFLEAIKKFESVVGEVNCMYVMDRGFYSEKNLKYLLENKKDFLIGVPFTVNEAKKIVASLRDSPELDTLTSFIKTNEEDLYGICRKVEWYGHKEYVHVYFDSIRYMATKNKLRYELKELLDGYMSSSLSKEECKLLTKYFIINDSLPQSDDNHITVNMEVFNKKIGYTGWFILMSNKNGDTQESLHIYRSKDFVEKNIEHFKGRIGYERPQIKSSNRLDSKYFVGFLAVILITHMYQVKFEKSDILKKYTHEKIIRKMRQLNYGFDAKGDLYIKTLTAEQKKILASFDIPMPTDANINAFVKLLGKNKTI
jgi:transposase